MASPFEAFDKAAAAYYESKKTYSALLREAAQRQAEVHAAKEQEASSKQEQGEEDQPNVSQPSPEPTTKSDDSGATARVEDKLKEVRLEEATSLKRPNLLEPQDPEVLRAQLRVAAEAIAEAKANKGKGKGKGKGKAAGKGK